MVSKSFYKTSQLLRPDRTTKAQHYLLHNGKFNFTWFAFAIWQHIITKAKELYCFTVLDSFVVYISFPTFYLGCEVNATYVLAHKASTVLVLLHNHLITISMQQHKKSCSCACYDCIWDKWAISPLSVNPDTRWTWMIILMNQTLYPQQSLPTNGCQMSLTASLGTLENRKLSCPLLRIKPQFFDCQVFNLITIPTMLPG